MNLSVTHLSKAYGNCKAVDDVSFTIGRGEIVGLLGHNGAGKSTLIKCLMSAIKSYSGRITIDEHDVRSHQALLAEECSFLLEPSFCDYLSAAQNLQLLQSIIPRKSRKSIDEVLALVSLKKARRKKVSDFSFGMKQRLGLAQVFLSGPHFVILDEPTVGLDPTGIDILKNNITELSQAGVAVLFSSHQISDVFDICTRAIVMNSGKIVFDDDSKNLLKKRCVMTADQAVNDALFADISDERMHVEEKTLYINEMTLLPAIIDRLVENNYEITDIRTENNYDRLRSFLKTGA